MGLLDKVKAPRGALEPGADRPPTNFDELQDAVDAGALPARGGHRAADEPADAEVSMFNEMAASAEGAPAAAPLVPSDARSAAGTLVDSTQALPAASTAALVGSGLPWIGRRPLAQQQRILGALLALGLLTLLATAGLGLSDSHRHAAQVSAAGSALMQSQRLAKGVSQAVVGRDAAFAEVKDAVGVLGSTLRALRDGSPTVAAAPLTLQGSVTTLLPIVERAEKNANVVLGQQKTLTLVHQALRMVNRQSNDLLETVQALQTAKLQQGAGAAEQSAVAQLMMLTQRIGKSANEFVAVDGTSPEAVFTLGRDLQQFGRTLDALQNGSAELRLAPAADGAQRELLAKLKNQFELTQTQANAMLGSLQGLVSARDAQATILKDSEPLREGLQVLQGELAAGGGFGGPNLLGLLGGLTLIGLSVWGFLRLFLAEQAQRAAMAEAQRREAERQQEQARRVNDQNQGAILRLMNELQTVAEGDLTQQATVTEDITGAIADSVNYTVEELRNLVSQVHGTAARVTETTQRVEDTSTELLAASDEQLREIRDTGEAVLQMAGRINAVSSQAQQSAQVARQSLDAAQGGLTAVQNAIGGMNAIRDQIQETSKRIKRLGESSQEIGEITELISDITEQTNVLALNAAIQAASAGEAGRGFSIVAEEVQRLAERSADATRQIAVLVKTIQADTQDAVAAMARSTQGVVEGARLSDATGAALGDIDRVTRRLAELIEQISAQASREASNANVVAGNIQHIFAVTEQTGDGTRSTSTMVRELSRTAEELRRSVARFKIG